MSIIYDHKVSERISIYVHDRGREPVSIYTVMGGTLILLALTIDEARKIGTEMLSAVKAAVPEDACTAATESEDA